MESWLKEGADPATLAISAGVGISLGLCPILGVSTILCLGALVIARWVGVELHSAMALLANLVSVPVEVRHGTRQWLIPQQQHQQLALILAHMRVGEFVTGSPHMQVVKIHLSDLWKGHLAGDLLVGMSLCALPCNPHINFSGRTMARHPWLAAAGGAGGGCGGIGYLPIVPLLEATVRCGRVVLLSCTCALQRFGVAYVGLETDDVFEEDGLQLTPSIDEDVTDVHTDGYQASAPERSAPGRPKRGRQREGEEALLAR